MTQLSKTNEIGEFFSRLVSAMANKDVPIGQGSAEAFAKTLYKSGAKNILQRYLEFEQAATVIQGQNPCSTLANNLDHAADFAKQQTEPGLYKVVGRLLRVSAGFWRWLGNYTVVTPVDLNNQMLEVLEDELLRASPLRDAMCNFSLRSKDFLTGFNYAEDSVPLSLEPREAMTTMEKKSALRNILSEYPTADGISTVLGHLVNQPLYPLEDFLGALEESQKALSELVESKRLLAPDRAIIGEIIQRWTEAAESDKKHKGAKLKREAVGGWVFLLPNTSQAVLRIIISNVSDEERVGEARNVRIEVQPPFTGQARNPDVSVIPRILSWETGVRYDLLVDFAQNPEAGKKLMNLKLTFDDLTRRHREILDSLEIEVRLRETDGHVEDKDPAVQDEIDMATGGDSKLLGILEDAIATAQPMPSLVLLDDVEKAIAQLSNQHQYFELRWHILDENRKRALVATDKTLSDYPSTHVEMTEITKLLEKAFPAEGINWNRIVRDLVNKRWLIDENGLYRFRAGLCRLWVEKFGGTM